MEFGFLDFLIFYSLFIHLFSSTKRKIRSMKQKIYKLNVNYNLNIILITNPYHLLFSSEKLREKNQSW